MLSTSCRTETRVLSRPIRLDTCYFQFAYKSRIKSANEYERTSNPYTNPGRIEYFVINVFAFRRSDGCGVSNFRPMNYLCPPLFFRHHKYPIKRLMEQWTVQWLLCGMDNCTFIRLPLELRSLV